MSATADQVARLRRMVAEPTTDTYSDMALAAMIEAWPLVDALGTEPHTWNQATTPPTPVANAGWIPTYDLNSAAAEIWDEKAAAVAQDYDFSADGGNYSRSQTYDHYIARARYYRARRAPGAIKVIVSPAPGAAIPTVWLGNAAEPD